MKTLILFGGGDGGGLLITPNGIIPIPPFDPAVLKAIKATGGLVTAMKMSKDKTIEKKMSKMAIGMCNLCVDMVEQILGPLDQDRAIVYQDEDGGFTCGSTGKPPIPIPWPPKSFMSVDELISKGVIENDMVDLVNAAKERKISLVDVFERPEALAEKLGVQLSKKSASDLKFLAPSRVKEIKDEIDREVIGLFHAVLKDGKYIDSWFVKPAETARVLKFKLSDYALERITSGGRFGRGGEVSEASAIAAGVVWAGVCIAIGTLFVGQMNPINALITDRSGNPKF